jgi:hypothetical protein
MRECTLKCSPSTWTLTLVDGQVRTGSAVMACTLSFFPTVGGGSRDPAFVSASVAEDKVLSNDPFS